MRTSESFIAGCLLIASWPAASLAGQEACPTCVNQLGATPLHDAAWSGNRELAVDDYLSHNINYLRDVLGVKLPPHST